MVKEFQGEYRFLSNFYLKSFCYKGKMYDSAEHAFQSAKAINEKDAETIRNAKTPSQAKKMGKKISLRTDWYKIKLSVMKEILVEKFKDKELRQKLLETGNELLIEGNGWHDEFWGVDKKTGRGYNNLGRLLMEVRNEINLRQDG